MNMNISDVRVRLVKSENSKVKASVSITIDGCFVVHDIRVIEGNDGYFAAMPSRKGPEGGFKDIVHPLDTATRTELNAIILKAFEEAKNAAPAEE